jgi:hypothetical protein
MLRVDDKELALSATDQAATHPTNLELATQRLVAVCQTPAQAVFAIRALNALAKLTEVVNKRTLKDIAGADSDYGVLLRILQLPDAMVVLDDEEPHVAGRLRGLQHRQTLFHAEGGILSSQQVATHLGITRQAVDKRRRSGRLIAVNTGRRGYAYPAWQFDGEHGTLPGLREVLDALSDFDPWMQVVFMLNSNERLDGRTPLALLRRDELAAVLRAAHAYGEYGAA